MTTNIYCFLFPWNGFHEIASICFSKKCWPFNRFQSSKPKCLQNTKFPGKAQPFPVQASAEHMQAVSRWWSSLEQWWRRQPRQDGLYTLNSIVQNGKNISGKTLKQGIASLLRLSSQSMKISDRQNRTMQEIWVSGHLFFHSTSANICLHVQWMNANLSHRALSFSPNINYESGLKALPAAPERGVACAQPCPLPGTTAGTATGHFSPSLPPSPTTAPECIALQ